MKAILELLENYKKLNFFKKFFFPWQLQRALLAFDKSIPGTDHQIRCAIYVYQTYQKSNFIAKWLFRCLNVFAKSPDKSILDQMQHAGSLKSSKRVDNFKNFFSFSNKAFTPILETASDDEVSFYTPRSSFSDNNLQSNMESLQLDKPLTPKESPVSAKSPSTEIDYAWFEQEASTYNSKAYLEKFKNELLGFEAHLSNKSSDATYILNALNRYVDKMLASYGAWTHLTMLLGFKAAGDTLKADFEYDGKNRDVIPRVTDAGSAEAAMVFARHLLRYEKVQLTEQEISDIKKYKHKTAKEMLERTLERGTNLLAQIHSYHQIDRAKTSKISPLITTTKSHTLLDYNRNSPSALAQTSTQNARNSYAMFGPNGYIEIRNTSSRRLTKAASFML